MEDRCYQLSASVFIDMDWHVAIAVMKSIEESQLLITMRSGNIRTLQKILGHQKIETTQIYSHIIDEYLKKISDEVDRGLATMEKK